MVQCTRDVYVNRFHGTVYPCPETQSERREMAMGVVTRIEDLRTVRSFIVAGDEDDDDDFPNPRLLTVGHVAGCCK